MDNAPQLNSLALRLQEYSLFGLLMHARDWLARSAMTAWCTFGTKLQLRLLRCHYGTRLRVDGWPVIRAPRPGSITLGEGVRLNSRFRSNLVGLTGRTVLQCIKHGRIVIGDGSGCSAVVLSSRASITVGRHVLIGGNARIYDHDYHALGHAARRDPARDQSECRSAPVVIADDVLIGTSAIILKGVTIGARSVIGAGAVVTSKNVPPDSLVAGNPARVIRQLRTASPL